MSSWGASGDIYDFRSAKGLLPRWDLDSLPPFLGFLDPHNLPAIVAANVAYLLVIFVIVEIVKRTGPASDVVMKPFMKVYNITCVGLAGAVVYGLVLHKVTVDPGSFVCNKPLLGTKEGVDMAWFMWIYYAQKYWEFLDTVIFALRGSTRQLTFLHLYHHTSITFVTSAFLRHDVNGDCFLAALANSFIHVLMYGHYFVSAFGVQTWWRKHLTSMQLVQFLTIFTQAGLMWARGPECGYPDWTKAMMIVYQTSMLYLFGSFFTASYGGAKKGAKKA